MKDFMRSGNLYMIKFKVQKDKATPTEGQEPAWILYKEVESDC